MALAKHTPQQLAKLVVCSNHFTDCQYMCPDRSGRLLPNQLPSLHLPVSDAVPSPPLSVSAARKEVLRPVSNTVMTMAIVHGATDETSDRQPALARRPRLPAVTSPMIIEECPTTAVDLMAKHGVGVTSVVSASRPSLTTITNRKLHSVQYHYKRSLVRSTKVRSDLKLCRSELLKECKAHTKAVAWKDELPSDVVTFLEEQIAARSKKKCGHRWTPKTKAYALAIYFKSPAAYKVVKELLALPSKSTLLQPLRHILETVTHNILYCIILYNCINDIYYRPAFVLSSLGIFTGNWRMREFWNGKIHF